MIACISQSYGCLEETVNTLQYALRATNIKRKIYKNTREDDEPHLEKYKLLYKNLQATLENLVKFLRLPTQCPCCKTLFKPALLEENFSQVMLAQMTESNLFDALQEANRKINENIEQILKTRTEL